MSLNIGLGSCFVVKAAGDFDIDIIVSCSFYYILTWTVILELEGKFFEDIFPF